jgi:hypothetical protein
MSEQFLLRAVWNDGTTKEIELTAEQAHALGAGQAIAYHPHDERVFVTHDGRWIERESAIPPAADAA